MVKVGGGGGRTGRVRWHDRLQSGEKERRNKGNRGTDNWRDWVRVIANGERKGKVKSARRKCETAGTEMWSKTNKRKGGSRRN